MNHTERDDEPTSTPVEPSDRRSFIKSTIVGAGAVATGLAALNTETNAAQARGFKGTVSARFSPKAEPTLDELQSAIAQIVRENGCRACGLIGFDIRLIRVNPATRFKNINVKGAEVVLEEVG